MSKLETISQIAVPVKNTPRAVKFYRDVLGLQLLFEAPKNLAFFNCGGVRLMLDVPEEKEFANNSSVLYFKVSDINSTYDELKSAGAEFIDKPHMVAKMPDHELWMTFFRDGEGNTLALMSEVR
jgi:methylmalonyl-CoA/ethylmalonyl-CoA epimerase